LGGREGYVLRRDNTSLWCFHLDRISSDTSRIWGLGLLSSTRRLQPILDKGRLPYLSVHLIVHHIITYSRACVITRSTTSSVLLFVFFPIALVNCIRNWLYFLLGVCLFQLLDIYKLEGLLEDFSAVYRKTVMQRRWVSTCLEARHRERSGSRLAPIPPFSFK